MISMLKDDLKDLFETDKFAVQNNEINSDLLGRFDNIVLNSADEDKVSQEVFAVYKKFVSMKQDAPDSMKSELFRTIRNYAREQFSKNNFWETLILYRFLIVKSNLISQDYFNIAESLFYLGAHNEVKEFLNLYKIKEENKLLLFINLADFYKNKLKDYKNAIHCYEQFIQTDKTKPVVYSILADLYSREYGDESLDIQISYYEKSNELRPNNRLNLHGLAFAYEKTGDNNRANLYYKLLLQNNPTEIDYLNYGMFLIHTGKMYEGHKYFTHRFLIDDVNLRYPVEESVDKKWDFKTDLSDKTLLVHYEQGFGDTIMYCRFLPLLKTFAQKIIFVVQDELYDLILKSDVISGDIEIISDKADFSKINYDYSMALLDIPYVLKTETNTIPFKESYISIDESLINNYADKFIHKNEKLKIGIAYSGDKNANYNDRDISLNKFNILKDIPDIEIYSLQKDEEEESSLIIPLGNTFGNFTDTACAIKNMDIIVSSDNVILNLAGALGVKTIGLFNKYTNYRWFKLQGTDCGWYKSVKPLQNTVQDNWSEVFSQVVNILSKKNS